MASVRAGSKRLRRQTSIQDTLGRYSVFHELDHELCSSLLPYSSRSIQDGGRQGRAGGQSDSPSLSSLSSLFSLSSLSSPSPATFPALSPRSPRSPLSSHSSRSSLAPRAPRGSPRAARTPTLTRLQLVVGPDGEFLTDSLVVHEAFEMLQHSRQGGRFFDLAPLPNSRSRMERVEVSIHMVRRRILTHPNSRMERVEGLEKGIASVGHETSRDKIKIK